MVFSTNMWHSESITILNQANIKVEKMNRLLATVYDRSPIKRAGLIATALVLLAGYFLAVLPTKVSAAACAAPSADYGTASATIKIDTAANYQVWSNINAPDATNNSYLLEIDGNTCFTVGDSAIPANTWTWVDYQNATASSKVRLNLTAGDHTIKMIGREPGVKLGRLLFVSDLNCVPTGNGDNCAVAGDLTPPVVDVTAPAADANVANTVNVAASASDNVAVTKVEFFVNGVLKSSDSSAPYGYSWDSKTVQNGTVSLMAKAYDAAGNTSSDTVSVKVANGDSQAPSIPSGVSAQANAYNKVTVSWTASTDNTGVTGYRVLRNGVTVAQVTTGTQYVDTTVLPNTSYSYQVSAYDAAGNNSGLSSASQVTTPNQPDTQAPSAPGNLSATAISKSQINLAWAASTDNIGVASYDVYRSVNNGSPVKVATVTTTSYGDTGLAASTAYAYYVVAKDTAGNTSANSNTATAQTLANQGKRGGVKGRVTFAKNSDNHAHVTITADGVRQTYDTDRRGNYTLSNLPAGTYTIHYSAKGSYSKQVRVKVDAGKMKTQNVKLRQR